MGIWAQLTETWILPQGVIQTPRQSEGHNRRDTGPGYWNREEGNFAYSSHKKPAWMESCLRYLLPRVPSHGHHSGGSWADGNKYQKWCSSQDLPAAQLNQGLQDGLGSWGGTPYMGMCYMTMEWHSVGSSISGVTVPTRSPNTHREECQRTLDRGLD